MRAPNIKLSFCLFLIFLLTNTTIAQENNSTEIPYDGVKDSLGQLTFSEQVFFVRDTFDSHAIFENAKFNGYVIFRNAIFSEVANFWNASFDGIAGFRGAKFNADARFGDATFAGNANFILAKFNRTAEFNSTAFNSIANFRDAKFEGKTSFMNAIFDGKAEFDYTTFDSHTFFTRATFDRVVSFGNATFDGRANFVNATFDTLSFFEFATFYGKAYFSDAAFDGEAFFRDAIFYDDAYFNSAAFDGEAYFGDAIFYGDAIFQKAVFKGVVNFTNSTFKKEIELRQSNFDSLGIIYLEDIKFFEGKFLFYWEQFKGKDSQRIKLVDSPADSLKDEHYTRIEIIYHKLRDNFIAQADKASADDVMYELAWQRAEILKEFHWQMYGVFFGYGYQPWRFLLFVVLPLILIFAGVWYWFYYAILVFINPGLFPKISDAGNLKQKDKHLLRTKNTKHIKLQITDFSYVLNNMNRLTRYWHALYFSTSVLLGIRFKKEWTKDHPDNILGRKSFIYFVTFEWALGIMLFVVFALLVKGIRFSFIKDLLGF